ncbi:MAG TPA: aromatic ring-hydroxylating dioxygenase subunit alpha [Bacteroidota bacterium]|nr:aromatic ring-hydroxylating dioxygenase subunit alpha [Bacteroidota bacterium]
MQIHSSSLPDFTEEDLSLAPLEQAETIPSTWYTDPRFHEIDLRFVLGKTWQGVGHVSKLQNPGDQIVGEAAGNPILVVRGDDHRLRAFFNVCRHRGGPLAIEDCNSKVLQCHYHGWTYLLDGSLRGTPKFNRVELFDKKDFGLVPIRLEEWEGLVFVDLSGTATSLNSILKDIPARITPFDLKTKTFFRRVTYDIRCNWKVYIDNYLEGYHLPYVHPELAKLLDYNHYVTETSNFYSLQYSPFTEGENFYSADHGRAFYYFVFPNFMLNILPGRLQTNLVLPVDHNHTRVIFDYCYDDISSPKALRMIEQDIEYSHKIQLEDIEICERVQKGLESIAYHKGRFSPETELGVYHFQSLLKQFYRRARNAS